MAREIPLMNKILIDAVIRGVLLTVVSDLLLTGYIVKMPALGWIIVAVSVLMPVISGWLSVKRESQNKRILGFGLFSFLLGIVVAFCLLLLSVVLQIRLFPADYMSNASGILFVIGIPWLLLITAVLRLIVFAFFFIRNLIKKKIEGDSLS